MKAADLEIVRDDSAAQVYRLSGDQPALVSGKLPAGLSAMLRPLVDSGSSAVDEEPAKPRFRVKISRIQLSGDQVAARALLFANGQTEAGGIQVNATLDTKWRLVSNEPILQNISVVRYEKAKLASKQKWFQDATAALFEGDQAFAAQLTAGVGDWVYRVERFAGSNIYTRNGHALADVNGDGLVDLPKKMKS